MEKGERTNEYLYVIDVDLQLKTLREFKRAWIKPLIAALTKLIQIHKLDLIVKSRDVTNCIRKEIRIIRWS